MSKWIKCEDRLPNISQPVFLYDECNGAIWFGLLEDTDDENGVEFCRLYDMPDYYSQKWNSNGTDYDDDNDKPTHWLALPQPPESEGE